MYRRLNVLGLVVLMMVAMASIASATGAYFEAPEYITADQNGHFVALMSVYAGSEEEAQVKSEYLLGMENCTEDRQREVNCTRVVPVGGEYYFIYEGNLIDADIDGVIELGLEFCNIQETFVTTIEVRNAGTVATDSGSWDTLKALYR